jgi:lipopolysaccharide transport system ATP-binding protein
MSVVLKAENISKQYRLGTVGSGTLRDDVTRWWYKTLGKEDPLLKVGDTNDRTQMGNSDYVWALQDINFEVNQGEVLGIIGRNGAGKSTLLKILSKVTAPTTGNIKVNGRIASLLEVGTGFHPELTGKENIYLNGAILGMRKHEITRKLDEIVAFAGVERYIDTPVKRYSSGMYVRLAFAVAAHLESEILIIDEVLAVGDAEFQKKCLGKMGEISKSEGRTILFVSHNIQSVTHLCNKGILLINGEIKEHGQIDEVVKKYAISNRTKNLSIIGLNDRRSRTNGKIVFTDVFPNSKDQNEWDFKFDQDIQINFKLKSNDNLIDGLLFYMAIKHPFSGEIITNFKSTLNIGFISSDQHVSFSISIPKLTLRTGQYSMYFAIGNPSKNEFYDVIDENINLPMLNINPISMDIHENSGFFSIPVTLNV